MKRSQAECEVRDGIVAVCRRLAALGLIGATEGNVSARLAGDRILTTPAGSAKARLTPEALVVVDGEGRVAGGSASSELPMHLAIYRARPDARAIVHAHPLTAVALTLARVSMEAPLMPEAFTFFGGGPRTAPYAPPGSEALAAACVEALRDRQGCLLERHGAVTLGATLDDACDRMEALERLARVTYLVRALKGTPPPLSA